MTFSPITTTTRPDQGRRMPPYTQQISKKPAAADPSKQEKRQRLHASVGGGHGQKRAQSHDAQKPDLWKSKGILARPILKTE